MSATIAYYGGIVTDGLVLYMDAAKRDSYPGFGTNWNSVARGGLITGSLVNGPGFNNNAGGNIVFDGINDYVDCGTSTTLDSPTNITISAWINRSANQLSIDSSILGKMSGQNEGYRGYMLWWTGNEYQLYLNGGVRATSGAISANTWNYILGTYNGQNARTYTNGGLDSNNSVTLSIDSVNNNFLIGKYPFPGNRNFCGNIAIAQVYNRALSAAEVLQNYNATKGRFGL